MPTSIGGSHGGRGSAAQQAQRLSAAARSHIDKNPYELVGDDEQLLGEEEVTEALTTAKLAQGIEGWMTFLHPGRANPNLGNVQQLLLPQTQTKLRPTWGAFLRKSRGASANV